MFRIIDPNIKNDEETTRIRCSKCNFKTDPNALNMCVNCIRKRYDIIKNVPSKEILHFCWKCSRYIEASGGWEHASVNSAVLLELCVERLKGLEKVKIVDYDFVRTEIASTVVRVQLKVQGEIDAGIVVEQIFVVDFNVIHQTCDDCKRVSTNDSWLCSVRVHQRGENKRTLHYLEQLILKQKANENTLNIKSINGGFDFFYDDEKHAEKMIAFLQAEVLVQVMCAQELCALRNNGSVGIYRQAYTIEIARISRNDAICLTRRLKKKLKYTSSLCLVYNVDTTLRLVDPFTGVITKIYNETYYKFPLKSICNPSQFVKYIVMDIDIIGKYVEEIDPDEIEIDYPYVQKRKVIPKEIPDNHILCDVWVKRAGESNTDEKIIKTRSYLGNVLKVGDIVLGYNLVGANIDHIDFKDLSPEEIPDIILVRKFYAEREIRASQRYWKLKHLVNEQVNEHTNENDYEDFLEDLEEDPEYRKQLNIYHDKKKFSVDDIEKLLLNDSIPRIPLNEIIKEDDDDDKKMKMKKKRFLLNS